MLLRSYSLYSCSVSSTEIEPIDAARPYVFPTLYRLSKPFNSKPAKYLMAHPILHSSFIYGAVLE